MRHAAEVMDIPLSQRFVTHEVENQVRPLAPYDVYATDVALREALLREGAGWAETDVARYGPVAGGELMELGFLANENPPRFKPFDRYGVRIDEVEFHPAYTRIMELATEYGVSTFAWRNEDRPGAHVARAGLLYLSAQPEQGHNCPLTMTYASVPTLRSTPALATEWLPRVTAPVYDGRSVAPQHKRGNTVGMGMTEKQGGSDVRSNSTRATPLGSDGLYQLVGHKFFFSAPMSDAFLVLALTEAGLTCFLVPRILLDGTRNTVRIQRLKDKLGDRSNASSEVEFQGALAQLVGEPGRGVPTILEMVALTRQDCLIGSAAIVRQALVQAIHHARHRKAFGKLLVAQPLMQNVLADLALESEAALLLAMRVARAVDDSRRSPSEAAFARIATAIGKYWVCKRCAPFVNEAQECLGGAGYVEESILPRLFRQAPLNSIWEGSGNIQCLDVLRALSREPHTRDALFAELHEARGGHAAYDAELVRLARDLDHDHERETRARFLVERLALTLQASLLIRAGNTPLAEGFCATRLAGAHGLAFGTLPAGTPMCSWIDRAFPG
jgi:putative acyl-CoA dehydrogenase